MIRQLKARNQITLPPKVLDAVGAEAGDLFTVTVAEGKIVLIPARLEHKRTTTAEWKALKDLVDTEEARGAFTEYPTARTAKHHLRRILKR